MKQQCLMLCLRTNLVLFCRITFLETPDKVNSVHDKERAQRLPVGQGQGSTGVFLIYINKRIGQINSQIV